MVILDKVTYKNLLAKKQNRLLDELLAGKGIKKKEVVSVKEEVVDDQPTDFSYLKSIKGIGGKTIKDIERVYKDEEELINALANDDVPLRDDVVDKLKEYYKVMGR